VSAGSAVTQRLPRANKVARGVLESVDRIGAQAQFYGRTVVSIGDAVTCYTSELIRLIAQMSLGTGALVMIGGTAANELCPAQIWQLRNSTAGYRPPPL
jgi:phospholipid/cholesterol/gamma-HCH transport system permease protein